MDGKGKGRRGGGGSEETATLAGEEGRCHVREEAF